MLFSALFFAITLKVDHAHKVIPAVALLILVCIYIIGFSISWGPIMWNMIGQLFPLKVRGTGASIATFVNWTSNGLLMFLFPMIVDQQEDGSAPRIYLGFFIFAAFCVLAGLFVKFFVPETKGKTLEEIEKSWSKK
jgi:hypothetical protein